MFVLCGLENKPETNFEPFPKHTTQKLANHARAVRRLQVSGTGWIPFVQFKLYQGDVFQYKPGTRDWVESTQSETPESALRSERGYILSRVYSNTKCPSDRPVTPQKNVSGTTR